jgi:predicted alpha/beta-fold hydrolase
MIFEAFSEQSFTPDPSCLLQVRPSRSPASPVDIRAWLRDVHSGLQHFLPKSAASALLTEDLLTPDGKPVDVLSHFHLVGKRLDSLRTNWSGVAHTAQATAASDEIDPDAKPWPGAEQVWIPVTPELEISGWMVLAKEGGPSNSLAGGSPRKSDCIVVLPGLLGNNSGLRSRDLCMALREKGIHSLALELRGHGRTELRSPRVAYTFGTLETNDLLHVSRWLKRQPFVNRTGLLGFCWGANHAILTAFFDGRRGPHLSITDELQKRLPDPPDEPHYDAGVMAFSPVLQFEELIDKLDKPISKFKDPVAAGLQGSIKTRMKRKGYDSPSGSLRRLIQCEFHRAQPDYPDAARDAVTYLRLLEYKGLPDGNKLEHVKTPLLIAHAANDPMALAQHLADLAAKLKNPRVAMLVLPGGGHIGFAPYAKNYFYNLVLNFFDPDHGAAAVSEAESGY